MPNAPLKGLVLAGGYSRRMGQDKGSLVYHPPYPHREYLYQVLQKLGIPSYISARPDQIRSWPGNLPYIPDLYPGEGPLSGMISACQTDSHTAWLVLACDWVGLAERELGQMLLDRDPSRDGIYWVRSRGDRPEPLLAIWEAHVWEAVQKAWHKGERSPLSILRQLDFQEKTWPEGIQLHNVNQESDLNFPPPKLDC